METHKLQLEEGFTDSRGKILPIVHDFANVQMIWSKKGALRANHYHKTDTHTCYLVTGSIDYYWRNHGEEKIYKEQLVAGDLFKTGPLIDHEMVFTDDSIMVVVSEHKRDATTYDEDIVKITPLHDQYENV
jgi:uncharacterized RmlC-like cupin family protein